MASRQEHHPRARPARRRSLSADRPPPLDGRAHHRPAHRIRRLHRRYERKAQHLPAFVGVAAALICYRRVAQRDRLLRPSEGCRRTAAKDSTSRGSHFCVASGIGAERFDSGARREQGRLAGGRQVERRRVPVHCPMVRFSGRHLAYAGTGPAGGRSRCARWEAAAIRVSLGGQPFLYAALVDAVATEDLRAGPMAFGEDSEQDVLRSDMVVAEPSCLLRTQRDGPLGSRGVGESPRQFSDRGPKTSLIAARNRSGVVVSAMAFAARPCGWLSRARTVSSVPM